MKKEIILFSILFCGFTEINAQISFNNIYAPYNTNNHGSALIQTIDNGFLMTGEIFSDSLNSWNIYILKTNEYGDTLWSKTIGDFSIEDYGVDIFQLESDKYLIICENNSNYPENIKLIKIDISGNIIWTKQIEPPMPTRVYNVDLTSDFDLIYTGEVLDTLNGDYYIFAAKSDTIGNLKWFSKLSVSGQGYTIIEKDNNYLIGGISYFSDSCIFEIDSLGNVLWAKTSYYGGIYSIINSNSNEFIAVGFRGLVLNFNENGDTIWSINIGTEQNVLYSIKKYQNNFIVVGIESSLSTLNAFQISNNGNIICSDSLMYNNYCWDNNLIVTSDNGYAVLGTTYFHLIKKSEWDCTSNNNQNLFLAKDIKLYPNPTTDFLKIDYNKGYTYNIIIFNELGIPVLTKSNFKSDIINVSNLENGVYILEINDGKNILNRKFIKE